MACKIIYKGISYDESDFKIQIERYVAINNLFNENETLANEVYEALGFKSFDTKGVSLDTKERDGWKWIKLNGKNIGEVKLVKNDRRSKEVGLSIKLNEEYQNKGYGQIVHTLVADWAKNEFGDTLYSDFDNSQAEINTLLALTKKGYAEQIGDYGTQKDGRYSTDVRAFRIKTSDEIRTITSQQKQQAQQLYSQYLDTIFPDSKVKDIVYHGTRRSEKTFEKRIPYEEYGANAIYFANEAYAKTFGNLIPAILNIATPFTSEQKFMRRRLKPGYESPQGAIDARDLLSQNKNNDGLIGVDYSDQENNTYVVREPEQIHILGTKQDIEGFKRFVGQSSVATTNNLNAPEGLPGIPRTSTDCQ